MRNNSNKLLKNKTKKRLSRNKTKRKIKKTRRVHHRARGRNRGQAGGADTGDAGDAPPADTIANMEAMMANVHSICHGYGEGREQQTRRMAFFEAVFANNELVLWGDQAQYISLPHDRHNIHFHIFPAYGSREAKEETLHVQLTARCADEAPGGPCSGAWGQGHWNDGPNSASVHTGMTWPPGPMISGCHFRQGARTAHSHKTVERGRATGEARPVVKPIGSTPGRPPSRFFYKLNTLIGQVGPEDTAAWMATTLLGLCGECDEEWCLTTDCWGNRLTAAALAARYPRAARPAAVKAYLERRDAGLDRQEELAVLELADVAQHHGERQAAAGAAEDARGTEMLEMCEMACGVSKADLELAVAAKSAAWTESIKLKPLFERLDLNARRRRDMGCATERCVAIKEAVREAIQLADLPSDDVAFMLRLLDEGADEPAVQAAAGAAAPAPAPAEEPGPAAGDGGGKARAFAPDDVRNPQHPHHVSNMGPRKNAQGKGRGAPAPPPDPAPGGKGKGKGKDGKGKGRDRGRGRGKGKGKGRGRGKGK
jgi:hypothetical protein